MHPTQPAPKRKRAALAVVCLFGIGTVAAFVTFGRLSAEPSAARAGGSNGREATVTVTRRDFVRAVRLSGTVEAIQSMTISAPDRKSVV